MEPEVWYMRLVGGRGWEELVICLPINSEPRATSNLQVIIKFYNTVFFCHLYQFILTGFIEWRCPGVGRGGAAGMAAMRRSQGLAPAWAQPILDGSSWLCNAANAGHSWACQWCWWCLCETIFKKGMKTLEGVARGGGKKEWETAGRATRWEVEEDEMLHGRADILEGHMED